MPKIIVANGIIICAWCFNKSTNNLFYCLVKIQTLNNLKVFTFFKINKTIKQTKWSWTTYLTEFAFAIIVDYSNEAKWILERTTQCEG